MFNIEEELKKLPDSPGVYLMKNSEGEVIYVGKAISLRKRVRSYFRDEKNQHPKVRAMVSRVESFDYILVGNEVEALVLESNLIKDKKPKYNILLRDDKSYPYIKITKEVFPRLMKTRRVLNDGAKYFGPYPNALAVNDIVKLLHEIYPIRTCNLKFEEGQRLKRPCLNYFIDRCPGPCVDLADEGKYMENIADVEEFLKGHSGKLEKYLTDTMKDYAKDLKYELAAKFRDYLLQIDTLMQKQRISKASSMDLDLLAMAKGEKHISIQVFFMRSGKVIDRESFILSDEFADDRADIFSAFIKQFYLDASFIPKEILVENLPTDSSVIEDYLSEKRGSKVTIKVPQKGDKFDLLKIVRENAIEAMKKFEDQEARKQRALPLGYELFLKELGLKQAERIEAYDISNISGVQAVGSMIVFSRGKKDSKEYRKFKIKGVEGPNDYASMEEVLTRRFKRYELEKSENSIMGFGKLPDLIIMDGGKGQVGIAKKVLKDFGLSIEVCGLVKDDKHNTRGVIYEDREIFLKVSSPTYRFLYSIQEEAHRFAINYHRKLRDKDQVASVLDDIEGVGKIRRLALLQKFKSVENIKKASLEELMTVDKINQRIAENIIEFFKGEESEDDKN